MTIYLSVAIFTLICQLYEMRISQNLSQYLYWLIWGILFVIFVFRSPVVGTDTSNYVYGYLEVANLSFSEIFYQTAEVTDILDVGWLLFNKCLTYLSQDPKTLFATVFVINMIGIHAFIREFSNKKLFSLFLFYHLYFFCHSLNLMAQSCAIALVALALTFLIKGKTIKYLMLIAVATYFFHDTSIIFLATPLILWLPLKQKQLMIMVYTLLVIGLFGYMYPQLITNIVDRYLIRYAGTKFFNDVQIKGTMFLWVIDWALIVFNVHYLPNYSKKMQQWVKFEVFFLTMSVLFEFIGMKIFILFRLALYFDLVMLTIIPRLIDTAFKRKDLVHHIVSLAIFAYFVYLLRLNHGEVWPFVFG